MKQAAVISVLLLAVLAYAFGYALTAVEYNSSILADETAQVLLPVLVWAAFILGVFVGQDFDKF